MTDTVSGGENAQVLRRLIPVLSAAKFVIGMGAFMVIGLLEPLSDDLGVSAASAGWVMTVYALSYAVLSPLLVSATGDLGRRRVLAAGMALFAAGCALSALAPGQGTLFAGRIIASAGAGIFTPVAAAVAAGLSPPEQRGKTLAAVFFGLTLSQVFGVPLGAWVAYTFGWREAFWLVTVMALVFVWLVWRRVPRGLHFQPVSLRDLGRVLRNGPTMLAVLFTATFLTAIYIPFTYIAPLLSQTMGWGRDGITLALVVYGCGAVAGNLMGGRMADRIGTARTLTVLAAAQVVLMPLFSILPMPQVFVFALLILWPLFGWSFMAAQQNRLITLAPEAASVVLALNAASIYVGAAIGSAIGGGIFSAYGLHALGIGGGIVGIFAVAHIALSRKVSGSG